MEIFESNGSFCNFYPKFAQNFLYTQNEQEQSANMKRAIFKYLKCKFSSQTDHSVIYTQLWPKLSLY